MTTQQLINVGIIISAKDLYSRAFAKAQTDLKQLSLTAKDQAAAFERNLRVGKTLTIVGGTMAAFGYQAANMFEDIVRVAGESESNLSDVLIAAGDAFIGYETQVRETFDRLQRTWGESDEAISASIRDIGGRTGDWVGALDAVNVAAALAKAKKLDLAQATDLLVTTEQQYKSELGEGLTTQERYLKVADKLGLVLARLGSNKDQLSMALGTISTKMKAAGQDFATFGAVMSLMGREGARMRGGAQGIMAMLEALSGLKKYANWRDVFPNFARTGNIIDLMADAATRLSKADLATPAEKLSWIDQYFSGSAESMLYLVQNVDELKKLKDELDGTEATTEQASATFKQAAKQMETWSEALKRFNAQLKLVKELAGSAAIGPIMWLEKGLGKIMALTEKSGFWRAAVKIGGLAGLGIAELAKYAGAIASAAGVLLILLTKKKIEEFLKVGVPLMNVQAGVVNVTQGVPGTKGMPGGVPIPGPSPGSRLFPPGQPQPTPGQRILAPSGQPMPPYTGGAGPGAAAVASKFLWNVVLDFLRAAGPKGLGTVGFLATPTVIGPEWGEKGLPPWEFMEGGAHFVGPVQVSNLNVTVQSTGDPRHDGRAAGLAAYEAITKEAKRQARRFSW